MKSDICFLDGLQKLIIPMLHSMGILSVSQIQYMLSVLQSRSEIVHVACIHGGELASMLYPAMCFMFM
jgi:hypothetical protein